MKNKKTPVKVVNIDAGTGKFVTKKFALKNPKTTISHKVLKKSK